MESPRYVSWGSQTQFYWPWTLASTHITLSSVNKSSPFPWWESWACITALSNICPLYILPIHQCLSGCLPSGTNCHLVSVSVNEHNWVMSWWVQKGMEGKCPHQRKGLGGFTLGSCTHSYWKVLRGQALLKHAQFKVLLQESWTADLGL